MGSLLPALGGADEGSLELAIFRDFNRYWSSIGLRDGIRTSLPILPRATLARDHRLLRLGWGA
jgi:hypothetical protein